MNGKLWAITSYYNPLGYRRRAANYHLFRERLQLPVLTVEWSPTGQFELQPGDADILIQLDGGDVMWQKERLLNIGVARLPPQCTEGAWLDCDLVFEREDLGEAIVAALDKAALVQLFDCVAYLDRTPLNTRGRLENWAGGAVLAKREGAAFARGTAASVPSQEQSGLWSAQQAGFAWAARRELLERHPLFDDWIVGGGDIAFFHAAAGTPERVVARHSLAGPHRDHFLPRARDLAAAVTGRIGHVSGRVLTLWHGSVEDRQYKSRHSILERHGFDPRQFLRRSASDVWEWAHPPHGLPDQVRAYFEQRNEDGLVAVSDRLA